MKLAEKQGELTAQLAALKNGQDRLALLVEKARERPPFTADLRVEKNLIPGCLARLWFVAEWRDEKCCFNCDSDSLVVKAIAGLLCDFYSGHAPLEILAREAGFFHTRRAVHFAGR